jgi:hypothetical protein
LGGELLDIKSLDIMAEMAHFDGLSKALYIAKHKAREALEARCKIKLGVVKKEMKKKQDEFLMLVQRIRMQRLAEAAGAPLAATGAYAGESKEERQERMEREARRGDLRRERYRARLLQKKRDSNPKP